ncbi:MAG TPA: hypothetical protein VFE59_28580 [Trebonia sp.]|nr:hypothetical protein [Trebonia sp.]
MNTGSGTGTPPERQPGGDCVLVSAQAGNEGLQRGLAAGGGRGHPLLELAAAPPGHQAGGRADVPGEGGQFGGAGQDSVQAGLAGGIEVIGSVMIQLGGGHDGVSAETREVVADAGVAAGADLLPQLRSGVQSRTGGSPGSAERANRRTPWSQERKLPWACGRTG